MELSHLLACFHLIDAPQFQQQPQAGLHDECSQPSLGQRLSLTVEPDHLHILTVVDEGIELPQMRGYCPASPPNSNQLLRCENVLADILVNHLSQGGLPFCHLLSGIVLAHTEQPDHHMEYFYAVAVVDDVHDVVAEMLKFGMAAASPSHTIGCAHPHYGVQLLRALQLVGSLTVLAHGVELYQDVVE